MRIKGEAPFAYIDNEAVTRSHLDGGAFGQFARHLLWVIICDLHQRTIGYRINFVTEKRIARELILRTRRRRRRRRSGASLLVAGGARRARAPQGSGARKASLARPRHDQIGKRVLV